MYLMYVNNLGRVFNSSVMLSVHLLETFLHPQSKLYLNIFQMKLFTLGLVLGSASSQYKANVRGGYKGRNDNQAGFMNEIDFGGFIQNSPAGKIIFQSTYYNLRAPMAPSF